MSWYKIAQNNNLQTQLENLRPQLAQAAQEIYDQWDQTEEDSGGICDEISNSMGYIISSQIKDVEIIDGGQDGDDHAWLIVYDNNVAFEVDIPPEVYETGGGYNWSKKPNITITPQDVLIFKLDNFVGDNDIY